ncbi:MAG: VOC family protein [Bacteroidota bacterium]
MKLGRYSTSLTVKDIRVSLEFYEKLGFTPVPDCGSIEAKWLILEQGNTIIGLFQDMFPKNTMTFNPMPGEEDVRALQAKLKEQGVALIAETDPEGTGPGYFTLEDPDGNPILVDQHH